MAPAQHLCNVMHYVDYEFRDHVCKHEAASTPGKHWGSRFNFDGLEIHIQTSSFLALVSASCH